MQQQLGSTQTGDLERRLNANPHAAGAAGKLTELNLMNQHAGAKLRKMLQMYTPTAVLESVGHAELDEAFKTIQELQAELAVSRSKDHDETVWRNVELENALVTITELQNEVQEKTTKLSDFKAKGHEELRKMRKKLAEKTDEGSMEQQKTFRSTIAMNAALERQVQILGAKITESAGLSLIETEKDDALRKALLEIETLKNAQISSSAAVPYAATADLEELQLQVIKGNHERASHGRMTIRHKQLSDELQDTKSKFYQLETLLAEHEGKSATGSLTSATHILSNLPNMHDSEKDEAVQTLAREVKRLKTINMRNRFQSSRYEENEVAVKQLQKDKNRMELELYSVESRAKSSNSCEKNVSIDELNEVSKLYEELQKKYDQLQVTSMHDATQLKKLANEKQDTVSEEELLEVTKLYEELQSRCERLEQSSLNDVAQLKKLTEQKHETITMHEGKQGELREELDIARDELEKAGDVLQKSHAKNVELMDQLEETLLENDRLDKVETLLQNVYEEKDIMEEEMENLILKSKKTAKRHVEAIRALQIQIDARNVISEEAEREEDIGSENPSLEAPTILAPTVVAAATVEVKPVRPSAGRLSSKEKLINMGFISADSPKTASSSSKAPTEESVFEIYSTTDSQGEDFNKGTSSTSSQSHQLADTPSDSDSDFESSHIVASLVPGTKASEQQEYPGQPVGTGYTPLPSIPASPASIPVRSVPETARVNPPTSPVSAAPIRTTRSSREHLIRMGFIDADDPIPDVAPTKSSPGIASEKREPPAESSDVESSGTDVDSDFESSHIVASLVPVKKASPMPCIPASPTPCPATSSPDPPKSNPKDEEKTPSSRSSPALRISVHDEPFSDDEDDDENHAVLTPDSKTKKPGFSAPKVVKKPAVKAPVAPLVKPKAAPVETKPKPTKKVQETPSGVSSQDSFLDVSDAEYHSEDYDSSEFSSSGSSAFSDMSFQGGKKRTDSEDGEL